MRPLQTTRLLLLAGFLSLLALPAGCRKGGGSGTAASSPPTLVCNNNAEPQTLDPGIQKGVPEHNINICLFEGLTTYDPRDLSPRPGVAESWKISDDGTVYTFHLREARWSNGDPVTAADFEWSWKRVLDPALASEYVYQIYNYVRNSKAYFEQASAGLALQGFASLAADKRLEAAASLPSQVCRGQEPLLRKLLEAEKNDAVAGHLRKAAGEAATREDVTLDMVGVKALSDRTLEVTLESPTPYFLDLTAFFTYYPVHRPTVERHGAEWTRPGNHVGNGPFRMKEWKMKEYILIEKSPTYWDAANVPLSQVKFLPVENQTTAFNMYEKGQVDWLMDVPREFIEELMGRPDYHTGPFLTTYFYGFNCTRGPTKDRRVRRALGLAINKEEIVRHLTRAGERAALSIVPPGLPGYTPAEMPAFDPAEARRLLAEAGYPGGKGFPRIEILYNTLEMHKKIAAAIQEMWRKHLRIEVELRNVEWKIYLDMQSRLEFDAIRRGWVGDYTDPNTFIDMFTTDSGNNNTGFSHPDYDRLVRDAARELDPARRRRLLHDAEALLMEEMPVVPIYFYVTKNMWRPSVEGLYDNVRDTHPLNRVRISGHAH